MRDPLKHFPVNWMDGMKINKTHFIAQDDAWRAALSDVAALSLSPVRYGLLPAAADGSDTFNVAIAPDNQRTLRITVNACQAVTPGGVAIHLPGLSGSLPPATQPFTPAGDGVYWVVLTVNPFEKTPVGSPDLSESPPRLPFALPSYKIEVVPDSQYRQYAQHPYALVIGKITASGSDVRRDEEYIPPCLSINAHPDLLALHGELDQFLGNLEQRCAQIVQKIYRKSQQNDLSELVLFMCDRVILHLGSAITQLRWLQPYESPAQLFSTMASLARVLRNTIDLRSGSGKDELMNYLSEWCELNQGEMEGLLSQMAAMSYDHNDVNKNIGRIVRFAKVIGKLFETLAGLEFIGKRKESGIFVKEEITPQPAQDQQKARRRFFG